MPICEPVMYKEKHLLFIWAPGGYERPYKARISLSKSNKETAYYVRRFSNTVIATTSDIKELHELGGNIPFDDRINHNAHLSDLRLGTMNEYLTTVGSSLANEDLSTRELAEAMKVTNGPPENVRPINVGLMFFNDDPSNFFREAIIEVIDIPDLTGEGMTERTFRGPLNYQLENAMAYIRNSIIAEKVFKHADRAEATRVFNYPYPAIEEALSNAVYHKSYQIPEPITVRIEKDNLSILSVPGPDRSISDEDIKRNHLKAKRYRNRRIGEFLKELDLIEERGTGVPTMLKSLSQNGSAPPTFKTDEDRSFFEVKFDIHPAFIEDISHLDKESEPKKRRSRQEIREAILKILEEGARSQSELRQMLGYSSISRTMTGVVNSLLKEGLIRYTTENERDPRAKLILNDAN